MILIGIGANRAGNWGSPAESVSRALHQLNNQGLCIVKASHAYRSAPVGEAGQGGYVNAVLSLSTHLPPPALLARLRALEYRAGRRASRRWSERPLDLDLLAYHGVVRQWPGLRPRGLFAGQSPPPADPGSLILPHPELHRRPFVVRPLLDIAPDWHHPVSGKTAAAMWRELKNLPAGRIIGDIGPLWT